MQMFARQCAHRPLSAFGLFALVAVGLSEREIGGRPVVPAFGDR